MLNCINPPIRGSIGNVEVECKGNELEYQSPYKGFNRKEFDMKSSMKKLYQSPYKGFNRKVLESVE